MINVLDMLITMEEYSEYFLRQWIQKSMIDNQNSDMRHAKFKVDQALLGIRKVEEISFPSWMKAERIKKKLIERLNIRKGTIQVLVSIEHKIIIVVPHIKCSGVCKTVFL